MPVILGYTEHQKSHSMARVVYHKDELMKMMKDKIEFQEVSVKREREGEPEVNYALQEHGCGAKLPTAADFLHLAPTICWQILAVNTRAHMRHGMVTKTPRQKHKS